MQMMLSLEVCNEELGHTVESAMALLSNRAGIFPDVADGGECSGNVLRFYPSLPGS